ncbi:hypothetical protein ACFSC6_15640 [Rufibacter sediminis]|nr:hypothetical protein [Rufibacter sediminis]
MTKGDIDPPPFFKSWTSMYWLVLGVLAVLILLFYLITEAYK